MQLNSNDISIHINNTPTLLNQFQNIYHLERTYNHRQINKESEYVQLIDIIKKELLFIIATEKEIKNKPFNCKIIRKFTKDEQKKFDIKRCITYDILSKLYTQMNTLQPDYNPDPTVHYYTCKLIIKNIYCVINSNSILQYESYKFGNNITKIIPDTFEDIIYFMATNDELCNINFNDFKNIKLINLESIPSNTIIYHFHELASLPNYKMDTNIQDRRRWSIDKSVYAQYEYPDDIKLILNNTQTLTRRNSENDIYKLQNNRQHRTPPMSLRRSEELPQRYPPVMQQIQQVSQRIQHHTPPVSSMRSASMHSPPISPENNRKRRELVARSRAVSINQDSDEGVIHSELINPENNKKPPDDSNFNESNLEPNNKPSNKYDPITFKQLSEKLSQTYNFEVSIQSTTIDIISVYLKGQKLLYIEAKVYCEQHLYALMLPAIFITAICSILSLILRDYSYGSIVVSCLAAVNSFILTLVTYLKLDAKAEAHKTTAYSFEKLQSLCEFSSGRLLFSDKTICPCDLVEKIGDEVKDIKDKNQFILPEYIRYKFPILYSTNVFAEVKRIQINEIILMNKLKILINEGLLLQQKLKDQNKVYSTDLDNNYKKQNEAFDCIIEYRTRYIDIDRDFKREINKYIESNKRKYNCFSWLKT